MTLQKDFWGRKPTFGATTTFEAKPEQPSNRATGFASKVACASKLCRLPQKEESTHSGNISPQTLQKPRRLVAHSFQFRIRHLAFQFIPNRKDAFQVGVMQERHSLFFRQGAIGNESFN